MYPIQFKQSPHYWKMDNRQVSALVNHRMAGTLDGTDAHFTNSKTFVSAHFGIGIRKSTGRVEISQYVDLSDAAWHAGNYDPSGGWSGVQRAADGSVINPNRYTIGIEHEDGNTGVVSKEILAASQWLQAVLLTGNRALFEYLNIRVRDIETIRSLAKITADKTTIIDHHTISGVKKPYCWRPYLQDTVGFLGFQAPLLAYLNSFRTNYVDIDEILFAQEWYIEALKGDLTSLENTLNKVQLTFKSNLELLEASVASVKLSIAQLRESVDKIIGGENE